MGSSIAALVRAHRGRAGLTQLRLAEQAGISVRAVRDIEAGRVAQPRRGSLLRLADALDLAGEQRAGLLAARAPADGRASVGVLGPLVVHRGDVRIPLASPTLRRLLTLLAIQPGRVVPAGAIAEELWPDGRPPTWRAAVNVHVSRLRRLLDPWRTSPAVRLIDGGYSLCLEDDQVDVSRFLRWALTADQAATRFEVDVAIESYEAALGCWRGAASGSRTDHLARADLHRRRLAATLAYTDVVLGIGEPGRAEPWLRGLAVSEPLHEGLHAKLMLVLAATGQQAHALEEYILLCRRLEDDLGVRPGAQVRAAYATILRLQAPEPALRVSYNGHPRVIAQPYWHSTPP